MSKSEWWRQNVSSSLRLRFHIIICLLTTRDGMCINITAEWGWWQATPRQHSHQSYYYTELSFGVFSNRLVWYYSRCISTVAEDDHLVYGNPLSVVTPSLVSQIRYALLLVTQITEVLNDCIGYICCVNVDVQLNYCDINTCLYMHIDRIYICKIWISIFSLWHHIFQHVFYDKSLCKT